MACTNHKDTPPSPLTLSLSYFTFYFYFDNHTFLFTSCNCASSQEQGILENLEMNNKLLEYGRQMLLIVNTEIHQAKF
jgi:hypothetical protein